MALGTAQVLRTQIPWISSKWQWSILSRPRTVHELCRAGRAWAVARAVIIDHARNRRAQKRGGQFEITSLSTDLGQSLVGGRPRCHGWMLHLPWDAGPQITKPASRSVRAPSNLRKHHEDGSGPYQSEGDKIGDADQRNRECQDQHVHSWEHSCCQPRQQANHGRVPGYD